MNKVSIQEGYSLPSGFDGVRRKRKLSAYNKHMQKCVKSGKKFTVCARAWKKK